MTSLPNLFEAPDSPQVLAPPFDQLVIVGAHPTRADSCDEQPIVLFVHPTRELLIPPSEFPNLPAFCFPNGFVKCTQSTPKNFILEQFIFELGLDPLRRIFGVCLVCSYAGFEDAFFYTRKSKQYPTCFCYLTTTLVPSAQFRYLTFAARWISGVSHGFFNHGFEIGSPPGPDEVERIPGLSKAGHAYRTEGFKNPRIFIQEISFVHTLRYDPLVDRPVTLAKSLVMVVPAQPVVPLCLAFASLDLLFSGLPVRDLVRLLSVSLLEKQILVLSSQLNILSLSILCLRDILLPFEYHGTFLPVLPGRPEFLAVLESPLPFIVGIKKTDEALNIPPPLCVVDLDLHTITDPDNSPLIARGNDLIQKLEKVLNENDVILPPRILGSGAQRQLNPDYVQGLKLRQHHFSCPQYCRAWDSQMVFTQRVVRELMTIFRRHLAPVLKGLLVPCFITDMTDVDTPVTVFNKEVFLASVGPDYDFYLAFMMTTMFHEFSDRLMDGTMRESAWSAHGSPGSPGSHGSLDFRADTVSTFTEDYTEFNTI
jgi:hypothetical protein